MKITAIGLIRVSTDAQAKTNDSISGQEKHIKKWAKENNVTIEKIYVEPGNSAFHGARPILNTILDDINNEFVTPNILLVYSYSRFTRKAALTAAFKHKLSDKGISIISVTEPLSDDEDTAFISQTVIDMVNEIQSRNNSKIVQDRLNDTAEKGFYPGGIPSFGYVPTPVTLPNTSIVKSKLAICPDESSVVKEIFSLAVNGLTGKPMGMKMIAQYLNDKQCSYRGKKWNTNHINRMLNNRIYYGDFYFGVKRVRRANVTPPILIKVPVIITKELFLRVQKELKSRRPLTKENVPINTTSKGIRSKTLLTGILKCEQCGCNLKIMTGKSGQHKYYKCSNKITQDSHVCNCPKYSNGKIRWCCTENYCE